MHSSSSSSSSSSLFSNRVIIARPTHLLARESCWATSQPKYLQGLLVTVPINEFRKLVSRSNREAQCDEADC